MAVTKTKKWLNLSLLRLLGTLEVDVQHLLFWISDGTSGEDGFLITCLYETNSFSLPKKSVLYSMCKYIWFTWAHLASQMLIRPNPCMHKDFVWGSVLILKSPGGSVEIPG